MAVISYKYAMILGENVENIALFENYDDANNIAKIVYGEDACAVDMEEWPVAPGYKYINGAFYEPDGETLVDPIPKTEKRVKELNSLMDDMTIVMADMIGGAV